MPVDIKVMLDDYNGAAMAVAGHAEWGFVSEDWYVAFPTGIIVPDKYEAARNPFANQHEEIMFIKANYHHVVKSAGSAEAALFVAMLRLHIAKQGMVAGDPTDRGVIEDEYVYVDAQGKDWDDAANNLPDIATSKAIGKYIKHHGNTIVHQLCYVFAARGHHWDPKYNELYGRLQGACFMSGNPGFQLPSNEVIYRLAIHGFGIKYLTVLSVSDKQQGKMAAAMFLRYDPAVPVAGTAHITTLNATLTTMHQEIWWGVFEQRFSNEIKAIEDETAKIHVNPFAYHVAAKVYGETNRKMASTESLKAFAVLCQFALGYIDHLGRRHSLSGQEAITQKSGGPRGSSDAFAKACDKFGKPGVDVATMAEFLQSI
jgi:hypothetical protein